jgi:hypothetical protein
MGSTDQATDPVDVEVKPTREVLPGRTVLTELARGFLLAQQSHPERAVLFAASFLRERSDAQSLAGIPTSPPVTPGPRRLGRVPPTPAEPKNFSSVP